MSDPTKWKVRPEGDGDWEVIQPIPNTEGHYVCIAYGLTEEHAHLIAAAHDMLEALKAMAEAHYDQPIGAWFGVIRERIAKATQLHTPHEL